MCRRKWLCPTCGYTASFDSAKAAIERIRNSPVALLTLTAQHNRRDPLEELWDQIDGGWNSTKIGSRWRTAQKKHGVLGYTRVTEVVHHPDSGWNPHFHALILLDKPLGEVEILTLKESIAGRFAQGVAVAGGSASLSAQDLRMIAPEHVAQTTYYCFKGTRVIRSAQFARTPMQILADLSDADADTGQDQDLWDEFATVVTKKIRRQIIHSRQNPAAP